jgi:hypothetical protein
MGLEVAESLACRVKSRLCIRTPVMMSVKFVPIFWPSSASAVGAGLAANPQLPLASMVGRVCAAHVAGTVTT